MSENFGDLIKKNKDILYRTSNSKIGQTAKEAKLPDRGINGKFTSVNELSASSLFRNV
jgi:hypothetical protein